MNWSGDWREVARLYRLQASRRSRKRLNRARLEALAHRDGEHLRALDTQMAILFRDQGRAAFAWFGSPDGEVRSVLVKALSFQAPESFAYRPEGVPPGRAEWIIDLESATLTGHRESRIRAGGALHRLLVALCRDFYRPCSRQSLFARVYPGRIYEPFSAPQQIHQLLERLKRQLQAAGISLRITDKRGQVSLHSEIAGVIRISRAIAEGLVIGSIEEHGLLELARQASLLGSGFSSKDAARALGISERSANRLIRSALESGMLQASGRARARRYGLARG